MSFIDGEDPYRPFPPFASYHGNSDAITLTAQYCQAKWPIGYSDEYILEVENLPWAYLGVEHLKLSRRARGDVCDGIMIPPEKVLEAASVFHVLLDHCRLAQVDLETDDGISYEYISLYTKCCLILRIVEREHLLPLFIAVDATDSSFPLSSRQVADVLEVDEGSPLVHEFLQEQSRFRGVEWVRGSHVELKSYEILPFQSLRPMGSGAQGSVDAVEIPSAVTKVRYARKRWRSPRTQTNEKFIDEIKLVKRLNPKRHVVDIINTYMRGSEVGIIMTLAECDLGHALSLPGSERRLIISDENLRHAFGCLPYALLHMHELGIRHKDIKPQNVLIRDQQLLFTDFGTSKDYSELSNTLTMGGNFTRKYAAPEFAVDPINHQAPADVFALGLVLLTIWSKLAGATQDFSTTASSSPYYEHMKGIHEWIDSEFHAATAVVVTPQPQHARIIRDAILLHHLKSTVVPEPADRVSLQDLCKTMSQFRTGSLFCYDCENRLQGDFGITSSDAAFLTSFAHLWPASERASDAGRPVSSLVAEEIIEEQEDEANRQSVVESSVQSPLNVSRTATSPTEIGNRDHVIQDMEPPTETPITTTTQSEAAEPQPSPLSSPSVSTVAPDAQITFVDCLERRFACPFRVVRTYDGMRKFIYKIFSSDKAPFVDIATHIYAGEFELCGPNDVVIDEDFWEDLIQPGWTVVMRMWPDTPITAASPTPVAAFASSHQAPAPSPLEVSASDVQTGSDHLERQRRPYASTESSSETVPQRPASPSQSQATNNDLRLCPFCEVFEGEREALRRHVQSGCIQSGGSHPTSTGTPQSSDQPGDQAQAENRSGSASRAPPSTRPSSSRTSSTSQTSRDRPRTNRQRKPVSLMEWMSGSSRPRRTGTSSTTTSNRRP